MNYLNRRITLNEFITTRNAEKTHSGRDYTEFLRLIKCKEMKPIITATHKVKIRTMIANVNDWEISNP
jgi:hypothetical protein